MELFDAENIRVYVIRLFRRYVGKRVILWGIMWDGVGKCGKFRGFLELVCRWTSNIGMGRKIFLFLLKYAPSLFSKITILQNCLLSWEGMVLCHCNTKTNDSSASRREEAQAASEGVAGESTVLSKRGTSSPIAWETEIVL